jgi:hypothetical protein
MPVLPGQILEIHTDKIIEQRHRKVGRELQVSSMIYTSCNIGASQNIIIIIFIFYKGFLLVIMYWRDYPLLPWRLVTRQRATQINNMNRPNFLSTKAKEWCFGLSAEMRTLLAMNNWQFMILSFKRMMNIFQYSYISIYHPFQCQIQPFW